MTFGFNKARNSTVKYQIIKLKVINNSRRVHKIFFGTPIERKAFVNTLLKAQGFNSQLEQYEIKA